MSSKLKSGSDNINKKIIASRITGLVVLIVAGLFITGGYGLMSTNSDKKTSIQNVVCGDNIVAKYNATMDAETNEDYGVKLKAVATEIESLSGYNKDSVCLYILVKNYLHDANIQKARQFVGQLSTADDSYLNSKIVEPENIQNMVKSVDTLEKNIKNKTVNLPDAG